MSFWSGRRVLVTGGTGFVGSHLVERLLNEGADVRVIARTSESIHRFLSAVAGRVECFTGDLMKDPSFAVAACDGMDSVIHLAAAVGGVAHNVKYPGSLFHDNVLLGVNVLDAAARTGIRRFLCVSSACVYARHAPVPTPEGEGFVSDPEVTNFGYGWAKRTLEVQARCYAKEFPIQIAIARPYNIYGPRDNFARETSHVIPALIRKVVDGQNPLEVWGDGLQTRSFLYVTDCVEGLMRTLEHSQACDPVNIGTDEEISIGDLIRTIISLAGCSTVVQFDTSKPSGQPRRNGDFSKARREIGFEAKTKLTTGLQRTIDWYREHRL